MRRRLILLTIGLVAVGGVALGVYYGQRSAQGSGAALGPATVAVQRGSLAATVNAAGNIKAAVDLGLSFGQSGTVKRINVRVGDQVQAGQVLVELDTTDLELQLQSAKVSARSAEDRLAQARDPSTAQDIASARAQAEAAQAAYNKAVAGPTDAELASARAALSSAQAAYDAAINTAAVPDSQLASASATLEKARSVLEQAQLAYNKASGQPSISASGVAQTLQSATIDYDQARAKYEALLATSEADAKTRLQQARSSLQQAQSNLAKVQNQVTPDDRVVAQATLAQAKNSLLKLLAGPDANALDIALSNVDQAQINVQQAALRLQQARLAAPFAGTVTAVSVTPGQSAGSGSVAVQLTDLAHLEITVNMAEVDIGRIAVGQAAEISLDALPDSTLQGRVIRIAPAGAMTQGVVNYPVTVGLVSPPAGVKTGMTANVNIVVDQRTNVLLVPDRALRTLATSGGAAGRQRTVTVLFEGLSIPVAVTTGLNSDTMTEIISGLKEGDEVVVSGTTAAQPRGGANFLLPGGPGR